MSKFLIVFLFGVFFICISIYTYKFIRYRKTEKNVLRFMTSCMILFTLTIVYYGDIFFNEKKANGKYSDPFVRDESNVFLSNDAEKGIVLPAPGYDNSLKDEDDEPYIVNKQEIVKITAYFDNVSPARGSITNLIVTGPPKGNVTAICQYKDHGKPYIMPIGTNGVAVIPIKVDNDAEPGVIVVVDITISHDGNQYKTNSVFTPQ